MIDGWLRRRLMWYFRRRDVLDAHKRRDGSCRRCGACCIGCPGYNHNERSCRIYGMRPEICRRFPLTPEDIRHVSGCGFHFKEKPISAPVS